MQSREEKHLHLHYSASDKEYLGYTYYLACIIANIQQFYGREEYDGEQIAAEIATATQDHIQLHFLRQSTSSLVMIPYVAGRRGFLVHCGEEIYGSLQIKFVEEAHNQHILPVLLCERLAMDCGWCLHALEREIEHQRLKHRDRSEAAQKISMLSPAQRKVLELMVKGISTRIIAQRLHLSKRTVETHQRNIYQILEVHSQREAILIGLAADLTYTHSSEREEQAVS